MTEERSDKTSLQELDSIVIRFAGDSGDGMQLTGTQFTDTSAILGNDISTLADFPAEIRAPAGTIPGVSGFQVMFSREDILTPGDAPQVLIAMNPAALKKNLPDRNLPSGVTEYWKTCFASNGALPGHSHSFHLLRPASLWRTITWILIEDFADKDSK